MRGFQFAAAAAHFTLALASTSSNAASLYHRRSACYASLSRDDEALADAKECVALRPAWPAAYLRLGSAHERRRAWAAAENAYENGRRCYDQDVPPSAGEASATTAPTVNASSAELGIIAEEVARAVARPMRGDAEWKALQAASRRVATHLQDAQVATLEEVERHMPGRSGLCQLGGG